ncbi:hypothetical protein IWQ56_005946, partial [Coemansia nantahalensis]
VARGRVPRDWLGRALARPRPERRRAALAQLQLRRPGAAPEPAAGRRAHARPPAARTHARRGAERPAATRVHAARLRGARPAHPRRRLPRPAHGAQAARPALPPPPRRPGRQPQPGGLALRQAAPGASCRRCRHLPL